MTELRLASHPSVFIKGGSSNRTERFTRLDGGCPPEQRCALGVGHQALAHGPRRVQVAERCQEYPAPELAAFMPARVRSARQSLSNWANAASTPSINLPVDVSSIGSVADRSEMPSDCRRERSAK